jgi:hypothetical protein
MVREQVTSIIDIRDEMILEYVWVAEVQYKGYWSLITGHSNWFVDSSVKPQDSTRW